MKKLFYITVCGMLAAGLLGCSRKPVSSSEKTHPSEGTFNGITYKADPSWTVKEEDGQLLLYPEGVHSAASKVVMYYTETDLSESPAEEICRETASVLWEDRAEQYSAEQIVLNDRTFTKASWTCQKDGAVQNGTGYITAVKEGGLLIVQYTRDAETEDRYGEKTEQFVKKLVFPE